MKKSARLGVLAGLFQAVHHREGRLKRANAMFDAVVLRPSAIALACVLSTGTFAQQQDWGTTPRETPGSKRLYDLPLVSELPADPSNCVSSNGEAQLYAMQQWSAYRAQHGASAQLPRVDVYQCSNERTVSSVKPGESLRDVTLGNVITVMPSGALQFMARGTGTFEKTAASPSSNSTPPAAAPVWPPEWTGGGTSPSPAPGGGNNSSSPPPSAGGGGNSPPPAWSSDQPAASPPPPVASTPPPPPPAGYPPVASVPPPPASAPPASSSGNCLATNNCGGSDNNAEEWGNNVNLPGLPPPPPSGGGSGWVYGQGPSEQP
jgi:hypothetical protein